MTAAERYVELRLRLRAKVAEWRTLANHPTPVMVMGEVLVLETVADEIEALLEEADRSFSVAEPVFAFGERGE